MARHNCVQDVGFFLTLFVFAGVLISALTPSSAGQFPGHVALVLMVHAWLSIYDGRFGRWRTVSWVALVVCMMGAVAVGFLNLLVPWGQMRFWLANTIGSFPLIGPAVAQELGGAPSSFVPFAFSALVLALLAADIAVMHWPRWGKRVAGLLLLVAGAIAAALFAGLALAWSVPPLPSDLPLTGLDYAILPDWYLLPFYSMLRSAPDKLLGVAITFAAVLVPIAWPWVRAERLRERFPLTWTATCIGLAVLWFGLGKLGSQEANETSVAVAQVLTVVYFAFFIGVSFASSRLTNASPTY